MKTESKKKGLDSSKRDRPSVMWLTVGEWEKCGMVLGGANNFIRNRVIRFG